MSNNKSIHDLLDIIIGSSIVSEPVCDVSFSDDFIFIELDIPNLDVNTLSVNIINGEKLEILGEKKRSGKRVAVYFLAERVFGKFKRWIELPFASSRVEKIEYNNGVLKIKLVRSE